MKEKILKICKRIKNNIMFMRYPFLRMPSGRNWWEAIPIGWRKRFGLQMCEELREVLIEAGKLNDYQIKVIKEKYGALVIYDNGGTIETDKILDKYHYISYRTCIICGKLATCVSSGWIRPYCDEHLPEDLKKGVQEYFYDIDWYGWTKMRTKDDEKDFNQNN